MFQSEDLQPFPDLQPPAPGEQPWQPWELKLANVTMEYREHLDHCPRCLLAIIATLATHRLHPSTCKFSTEFRNLHFGPPAPA
jgi:hypothetical protein